MSVRMHASRPRGISLVELMIAMALGLLVGAGVITAFLTTAHSRRAQLQLVRLQEEGRFAMTTIRNDLEMSGGFYCNNTGGHAHASQGGPYLDGLRAPVVYASRGDALMGALADVTTPWGHPYPVPPSGPYSFPSFLAMRGYDCTAATCTPMDPSNAKSAHGFGMPAMGTKVGRRVVGSSIITVRYLRPSAGWTLAPGGSSVAANADGTLGIHLRPAPGEPKTGSVEAGDLMMVADCSQAQIFAATGQGTATLTSTGNNFVQPTVPGNMAAAKVFDVDRDVRTVTYFLRVVDDGEGLGHTTGALMRRVNGGKSGVNDGSTDEIVRGVERLDFRYGVQYADGTMRFLSAAEVDRSTRADCPPVAMPIPGSDDRGCLWRAVSRIEIDLLMDGQEPLPALTPDELAYVYTTDTPPGGTPAPESPTAASRKVTPIQQGFPLPMLRREFASVVAVRNFNH